VITVNGRNHVVIHAKRDLQPGDELTYDYRYCST
jgi:SET domain-containing protein